MSEGIITVQSTFRVSVHGGSPECIQIGSPLKDGPLNRLDFVDHPLRPVAESIAPALVRDAARSNNVVDLAHRMASERGYLLAVAKSGGIATALAFAEISEMPSYGLGVWRAHKSEQEGRKPPKPDTARGFFLNQFGHTWRPHPRDAVPGAEHIVPERYLRAADALLDTIATSVDPEDSLFARINTVAGLDGEYLHDAGFHTVSRSIVRALILTNGRWAHQGKLMAVRAGHIHEKLTAHDTFPQQIETPKSEKA